jgi:hypothetical protein
LRYKCNNWLDHIVAQEHAYLLEAATSRHIDAPLFFIVIIVDNYILNAA